MKEVAKHVGYRHTSLAHVERNHSNLSQQKLQKLAEVLDVPVTELEQAPVHPGAPARKKAKAQLNQ